MRQVGQGPKQDDHTWLLSSPNQGVLRMSLLRNLARRRLRTALTVTGITIGIWALVVFGSMANKISSIVAMGSDYYAGKIVVTDKSGGASARSPMEIGLADDIAALDGVAVAVPGVSTLLDPESTGGPSIPDMTVGDLPGADQGHKRFDVQVAQGRALTAQDAHARVAVLGSDLARKRGKSVGDTLEIRGMTFDVVGILEPTLTAPDTTVLVPLAAAQEIFFGDLPPVVRKNLQADRLATDITVYPDEGTDVEALAARIEADIPNASAMTAAEFDEVVGSSVAIFNAIIIGVALISLIVGGLSVINTMAMSVAERTREIGIKRAIGGSRARVIRELVSEAGLIGLLGGLLGLGLGAVVVYLANEAGRSSGMILFQLTLQTAIFAVLFSTILGVVAGIIPAWNAARLDPVAALRYE
jgi:ABC-type transport system, involved in lipoprotein release, permease component